MVDYNMTLYCKYSENKLVGFNVKFKNTERIYWNDYLHNRIYYTWQIFLVNLLRL